MGPPTGYGNDPFSAQTNATTVSFGLKAADQAASSDLSLGDEPPPQSQPITATTVR